MIDRRGMLIHYRANLDHRFGQLFRSEDVTDAQRRIQNLAHRAGVNDAAAVIESLQTRERGAGKTKFRIVIVLENVSVVFSRKIDK